MNKSEDYKLRKMGQSIKWNQEFLESRFGRGDILPFWVADMDYPASPQLVERLQERARHPFYGYETRPESIKDQIARWCLRHHNWIMETKDLTWAPSVLCAISVLIELCSKEGEGVIIQPPVYYPFAETIRSSERRVLNNNLIEEKGFYRIDFDDLEKKARLEDTKILLISSPHNPVGRVWTQIELERMARICADNNMLLISDEIHMDIVYGNHYFYSTALLGEELRVSTVQLFSAGKTFNISGNTIGLAHFNNKPLQVKFEKFLRRFHLTGTNVFTTTALQWAFEHGGGWFDEIMTLLESNLCYIRERIKTDLPKLRLIEPEGTYLLWIDFSGYDIAGIYLDNLLVHKAGLALDPGHWFGESYDTFGRFNIGCPRPLLEQAFDRLEDALGKSKKG